MRERLGSKGNPDVAKYLSGPSLIKDAERSFGNVMKINLAHALMLHKQGIVADVFTKKLLTGMNTLIADGASVLPMNTDYEDIYYNVEQYLIGQLGIETAGMLHTARSRNDLAAAYIRMNVRDTLIKLFPMFLELRKTILHMAQEHKDTVVTGYTHMQPAQPITLGYYFSSVAQALERDFERLSGAYTRLNMSPMGACAFAGTGFDIDMAYVSDLLGFDIQLANNMDSIASRDYLLELASAFTIIGSTLSRFAQDLYYWGTNEFAYLEVDNSMAFSSSIMPQKKNPITIEQVKAKTSHLTAAFMDIASVLKGTPYGHSKDLVEALEPYYNASHELEVIFVILNSTLKTLHIHKDGMKDRADKNFCTATELADELVKSENLPFRLAYQIVGSVVGHCVDNGLDTRGITSELLDEAAQQFAGRKFAWSDEKIRKTLDSAYSVSKKINAGSPGPDSITNMLKRQNAILDSDEKTFARLVEKLKNADDTLKSETDRVLNI